MPVIPLELIDKYDAYVGRYVYLCGNENRERIDLRLVFRDGKEIGTDDLNLYLNFPDKTDGVVQCGTDFSKPLHLVPIVK